MVLARCGAQRIGRGIGPSLPHLHAHDEWLHLLRICRYGLHILSAVRVFFGGGRLYSQRLHTAIATLVDTDLVVKQLCDAIAVSGPGTASGTGSFFARDFQLATALVLQVCA